MSIRHLVRKLDADAIARVKAGIKHKPEPVKKLREPKPASEYRAARRNAAIHRKGGGVWKGAQPTGRIYRAPVRANRARRWKPFPGGKLYGPNAR